MLTNPTIQRADGVHLQGDSHDHQDIRDNINVRGAVLHVIGDVVQSIGVIVAALLITFLGKDDKRWRVADPICTIL